MKNLKTLMFAPIFWGMGWMLFSMIGGFEKDFKADSEAIANGSATEVVYHIAKKTTQQRSERDESTSGSHQTTEYIVVLEGPDRETRTVGKSEWDAMTIGQTFHAWHVNGRVQIPELDTGNVSFEEAKWWLFRFSIIMGCLPIAIVIFKIAFASIQSNKEAEPSMSHMNAHRSP